MRPEESARRRIRGRTIVAFALGVLVVSAASGLLLLTRPHTSTTLSSAPAAGIEVMPLHGVPAPNFSLTNQFWRPVTLSQFRGEVVVLTFVDDHCTGLCPLTAEMLRGVQSALGAQA